MVEVNALGVMVEIGVVLGVETEEIVVGVGVVVVVKRFEVVYSIFVSL